MAAKTKEDVRTEEPVGALVAQEVQLPVGLDEIEADSGKGLERAEAADYLVPILAILQKMSPELDAALPKYIKGAEVGEFINKATKARTKTVSLVVCYYYREIVEWVPRKKGGGLVGRHGADSEAVKNAKRVKDDEGKEKLRNDAGNDLVDTRYFCCLQLMEDGGVVKIVAPLKSTQIKYARQWTTAIDNIRLKRKQPDGSVKLVAPPSFLYIWNFNSVVEQKDQNTWYSWHQVGDPVMVTDRRLYEEARKFHELCASGAVKVMEDDDDGAGDGEGAGTNRQDGKKNLDKDGREVPY